MITIQHCHICGSSANHFAEATVLKKYKVAYYQCVHCDFVFTEKPYWLDEAYKTTIADGDTGLLLRNIVLSDVTANLLLTFLSSNAICLDYGGGYGVLTRLMRDKGFHFYHYDPYCTNLFSPSFGVQLAEGKSYDLLTAFEVIEHFVDPLKEIAAVCALTDTVFFSTLLLPSHHPKPGDWPYYALEWGQHVSIYSLKSLQVVAEKLNMHLYSNFKTLHLLSKKSISQQEFQQICAAQPYF